VIDLSEDEYAVYLVRCALDEPGCIDDVRELETAVSIVNAFAPDALRKILNGLVSKGLLTDVN
jgi:hypothetical protein